MRFKILYCKISNFGQVWSLTLCNFTRQPLVKVLRLVNGDELAMGFLYDAMDEAKEKISKNLKGDLGAYKEIWDVIDKRWEFQMHRHLHAVTYFMNPQFQYSDNFPTHFEVHTKKIYRFLTTKMHNLVYIIYNKRLKDRHLRMQRLKENENPLIVDHVPSDDEWMVSEGDELGDGNQGTSSKKRKDPLIKDKRLVLIDEDDEWIDHNVDDDEEDIGIQHFNDSSLDLYNDE
ncbi:hypothetical protein Dsin_019537 [Dipteronia sinensis]|uniref:Uncharacterized protein n=1 Tax=Dipteronia sinensis TaxID=43782 RepID=A0AAE0A7K9_9ROSI|nr:hypothetical protein Dsin_019537 [Dipteronia sinensis]